MNLADAIRAASTGENTGLLHRKSQTPESYPENSTVPNRQQEWTGAEPFDGDLHKVKVEFVLSHEELGALVKACLAGKNPILTLKEAAHWLRTTPKVLENMAEAGRIGGFKVEGKWRFPRTHLEEWMKQQQNGGAA